MNSSPLSKINKSTNVRTIAGVPFTDGAALAHLSPGAELVATERLGHQRILRDAAVIARAVQFVASGTPTAAPGTEECPHARDRRLCASCALERELYDRDSRHRPAA